jgi:hypothetical protein
MDAYQEDGQVRARATIEATLRSMGDRQANPPVSPAIAGGARLVEAQALMLARDMAFRPSCW